MSIRSSVPSVGPTDSWLTYVKTWLLGAAGGTDLATVAYVDAEVAGVVGGTGRITDTHAHSGAGPLAITRAGADQYTTVTISEDVIGFTDGMSNGDLLRLTFINGTAADFTMDLSTIPTLDDPDVDLSNAINMYETTVIVMLFEKIQGQVYAVSLNELEPGTTQTPPAAAVRGFYMNSAAAGVPGTITAASLSTAPDAGDGLLFVVVNLGPTDDASVTYTPPSGSTQLVDYAGSTTHPRMRLYYKTYASETDWTFGTDNSKSRVAVIAFENATTFAAGTPVATLNPGGVAYPAAGLGIYVAGAAWDSGDDSTWTGVPASHTLVVDNRASVSTNPDSQAQIAVTTLTGSGTYDPGVATFGTTASSYSAVAVAVTA